MEREGKGRSRRKQQTPPKTVAALDKSKVWIKVVIAVFIVLAAVAAAMGGIFVWQSQQYTSVYFPSTIINGIDAGGKTSEEVKALVSAEIEGYTLTLEGRNGLSEVITKEDINLHTAFDGSLETMLGEQDKYQWRSAQKEGRSLQIEAMIAYDHDALEEKILSLKSFDQERSEKPENAYLSEYVEGQGYHIVPEIEGNEIDQEKVKLLITDAILNLKGSISLEEEGGYKQPSVRKDDEALNAQLKTLNTYANMSVTYTFGSSKEVINGETIRDWITVGDDGKVSVSETEAANYIASLASKYDTFGKTKTLTTTSGPVVKMPGYYGWKINQSEETAQLVALIKEGESQTREPVYSRTAASHGEHDYGNTYVEINLTAQHLYFYKDGKLLVESDFVSGNSSRDYTTPPGFFTLTYKERNATLKGENYATPVSYWMPFNGNIGMHDADWRSSFGGTIYKTNGSHGCINLPPSVAKTIYENISAGIPVFCYNLEGTEQETTTTSSGTKETTAAATTAATVPETTTAAAEPEVTAPGENETEPEITAPVPTKAPETTQALQPPVLPSGPSGTTQAPPDGNEGPGGGSGSFGNGGPGGDGNYIDTTGNGPGSN